MLVCLVKIQECSGMKFEITLKEHLISTPTNAHT